MGIVVGCDAASADARHAGEQRQSVSRAAASLS